MSRRPNPAADKAAANQAVIKTLLKLPGNKFCADCKRNKLPRWASWNLGIFVCIRCSGIHRGMGTHISRVKSVDLDSWTDEQLASMVKWGNSKANKYWEANLAPGHVPSEAKIENFVRTKYEAKRWVMEGGIPDPSTLEDSGEEDNLPLKVVQQRLETRQAATPTQPRQNIDLFDLNDEPSGMQSPKPASATINQPAPKASPAPPKSTKPADSLLGLDFFGTTPTPSPRPTSVNSNPAGTMSSSRPDLNRSILSLYASAPKPQMRSHHSNNSSFSSHAQISQQQPAFGDLNDAFGGLNFASAQSHGSAPSISTQPTAPPPPKPSPFANLTAGMTGRSPIAPQLSPTSTTSGGFFGSPAHKKASSFSKPAPHPTVSSSSGLGDLFDFGSPAPAPTQTPAAVSSVYNLSASASAFPPPHMKQTTPQFSFDSNAWATPGPAASTASTHNNAWGTTSNMFISKNNWSSQAASPAKTSDDDWGAFNSGGNTAAVKSTSGGGFGGSSGGGGGGGGDDDLFANVWK